MKPLKLAFKFIHNTFYKATAALIETPEEKIFAGCENTQDIEKFKKDLNYMSKEDQIKAIKKIEDSLITFLTEPVEQQEVKNTETAFQDIMMNYLNAHPQLEKLPQLVKRFKLQIETIIDIDNNLGISPRISTTELSKINNNLNGFDYINTMHRIIKKHLPAEKQVKKTLDYYDTHDYAVSNFFADINLLEPKAKEMVFNEIEDDIVAILDEKNQNHPASKGFDKHITDTSLHITWFYKTKGDASHPYIKEFVSHLEDISTPNSISDQAYAKAMASTLETIATQNKHASKQQLSM